MADFSRLAKEELLKALIGSDHIHANESPLEMIRDGRNADNKGKRKFAGLVKATSMLELDETAALQGV